MLAPSPLVITSVGKEGRKESFRTLKLECVEKIGVVHTKAFGTPIQTLSKRRQTFDGRFPR